MDDEIINLELLKVTFMNEVEVIEATSAKEGLAILEEQPDIHVISYMIMKEHQGKLEVNNREDGVCFDLLFPEQISDSAQG